MGYLLYDTALLASGFQQDDLDGYSERMIRTLAKTLNLDSLDLAKEITVENEEKPKKTSAAESNDEGDEGSHDEF
jgi:hypothetical protein